ncbi:MAG TPA: ATP-grasp domain-containing protein [Methanotrichaceae archaeon]|nr:ATP-grasp domain-containing protein [Methanotrichaceae archaeon]
MRILAIGQSVRNIACSATRAGHEVIAADFYCDLDLPECACRVVPIPQPPVADEMLDRYINQLGPDAVVLGPGLETAAVRCAMVLNNPRDLIMKASDKLWLAGWLGRRGYPHIPTRSVDDAQNFPSVVKPRTGAGGAGCTRVRDQSGLDAAVQEASAVGEVLVQDWVDGIPASVSVIGNGKEARAVAVNEQLIGEGWTGAKGLRYSGNITPLEASPGLKEEMVDIAEGVASDLGLIGSNGIDFILAEGGPVVVEVNPRFQGSLEAVELAHDINIFQAHLESFKGLLPDMPASHRTAGRAIVYASRDTIIEEDLRSRIDGITDVPRIGARILRDEPMASILAAGPSRGWVFSMLRDGASRMHHAAVQK